jgi:CubicO group peptidase (beta-lactamase class C family)
MPLSMMEWRVATGSTQPERGVGASKSWPEESAAFALDPGLGFLIVTEPGASGLPSSVADYGWGGAYDLTHCVDPKEELVVVCLTQLIPAQSIDDHRRLRALIYQSTVDWYAAMDLWPRVAAPHDHGASEKPEDDPADDSTYHAH